MLYALPLNVLPLLVKDWLCFEPPLVTQHVRIIIIMIIIITFVKHQCYIIAKNMHNLCMFGPLHYLLPLKFKHLQKFVFKQGRK